MPRENTGWRIIFTFISTGAPANKTHKILASVVAAHGLFGGITAQNRIAKQQRDKQLWLISVF
jgi:hypothetical protein